MSQQGLRQESYRAIHGDDGDGYNADERQAALAELDDLLASGSANSVLIRWLQLRLDTEEDNLPGLLHQFAATYGADKWNALGTFPPMALPGQIIASHWANVQDFKAATVLLATIHEATKWANAQDYKGGSIPRSFAVAKAVNTSVIYPPGLVHTLRATLWQNAQAFHGADIPRDFPATLFANQQSFKSHTFGPVIAATKFANAQAYGSHSWAMAYAAAKAVNAQSFNPASFSHSYAATKAVNAQAYGSHAFSHSYPATLFQNAQAFGSHSLTGQMEAAKYADPDVFHSHSWRHSYPTTLFQNAQAFGSHSLIDSGMQATLWQNAQAFGDHEWSHDYAIAKFVNAQSFKSHEAIVDFVLAPDAILASTNLTGAVTAIDESVDSPDANWLTATDATADTDLRVSFPTPPNPPRVGAGLQTFRLWLRKTTGAANPTVDVELWENGSFVATLQNDVSITSTTGQLVEGTWNASSLSTGSGANVECRVVATAA